MRVWQAVGIGLLAITFSLPAWADCSHVLYGNTELNKTTLSIPTTIFVRKLPVLSHILPNIEVTLLFDAEMKFELSCVCKPCCSNQEKQVASLTVSASVEALGGTIWYEDSRSLTMDGVQDPECQLLVTLAHEKGATVPAVGVGLQIAGFSLKIEGVRMSFSAIPRCECSANEQCFFNTPPRIVDVSPQSLDLNKGESAEFTVTAIDFQGNLSHFSEATPAGPGYLRAYLKGEQYGKTEEGWEWRTATYRVSFPSEGEELEGRVVVTAWDGCGQHSEKKVLVRLFYPPRITLDPDSRWFGSECKAFFRIRDPNLRGCPDPWEAINLSVEDPSCGTYFLSKEQISCNWADVEEASGAAVVVFYPQPDCCNRSFTLVAQDLSRQSDKITVQIPDQGPVAEVVINPQTFRLKPGEMAEARVSCEGDPNGHTVTLSKESGPGLFESKTGRGRLRGTWSWRVPGRYLGSPWQLVGFRAKSFCGGSSVAYLLVHISTPPRAYSGSVWVNRGATARTILYVHDPDSFSHSFAFSPPPGISVQVVGQQAPREEDEAGGGHLYEVEVSADGILCPGTYPVPFTVTDQDGNSDRATLTVHVRGNQPPQAWPPHLQGDTTVTLTPTGVVRTPVVFQPINVWDPDGDPVIIEGYGIPPVYAANLSAFLGSLVALYTPGGLTDEDLCRAVRERDVYVDEFSLTLRDKCGATTEVPAIVTIRVEDKVPPKIVYPARDRTVECDGQGKTAELSAWLGSHGGGPGRGQPPIPPLGRTTTTQTSSCAPAGALGALR